MIVSVRKKIRKVKLALLSRLFFLRKIYISTTEIRQITSKIKDIIDKVLLILGIKLITVAIIADKEKIKYNF
ncbi:hypothetical protein CI088_01975 [Enterococcus plantarum]|uniref:Uncharacterized protein n=1 Tax=Enterococcus plantarum TaxID=1077675 RepID=A0A2W4BIW6_9ENTE|nr:hypothetical protein CI088_01975 [Enterococcus plantarum]